MSSGQGGGGRGDDAAGRRVRQRLQRDQRADDGLPVGAVVRALLDPLAPELLGGRRGTAPARAAAGGCLCEGCQEMVNAIRSPGATVKSAYVVRYLPYVSAVVSNHTESGPATATVRPSMLVHPRHDTAVREPHAQRRAHRHPAADALHDADQLRGAVARRHEIGHADRAARGVPLRFEDQRVAAVAAAGRRRAVPRPPRARDRAARSRAPRCRAVPRRRRGSRSGAGTASRLCRPGRPGRRSACPR